MLCASCRREADCRRMLCCGSGAGAMDSLGVFGGSELAVLVSDKSG